MSGTTELRLSQVLIVSNSGIGKQEATDEKYAPLLAGRVLSTAEQQVEERSSREEPYTIQNPKHLTNCCGSSNPECRKTMLCAALTTVGVAGVILMGYLLGNMQN